MARRVIQLKNFPLQDAVLEIVERQTPQNISGFFDLMGQLGVEAQHLVQALCLVRWDKLAAGAAVDQGIAEDFPAFIFAQHEAFCRIDDGRDLELGPVGGENLMAAAHRFGLFDDLAEGEDACGAVALFHQDNIIPDFGVFVGAEFPADFGVACFVKRLKQFPRQAVMAPRRQLVVRIPCHQKDGHE